MRLLLIACAGLVLTGCGSSVSTTFSSIGEELPAATTTMNATPEPTPGTAICDAFDVVNDVISPAYSSLAEGAADVEQLASTIEAAAAAIEDLADEEANPDVAEQIREMANRFRAGAGDIRRGDQGDLDAIDYYLDLVVEHADRGTCR